MLEKYSIILSRSLRKFGGEFSNIPIYSIAPRKGYYPSKKTQTILSAAGVEHINIDLNKEYKDDYFVNKFVSSAYIEDLFPHSTIVFLDSDQLFLNSPKDFILLEGIDVAVRMVDQMGIGISDEKSLEWDYWQGLYQTFGIDIKELKKHETSLGQSIYPYFQGGMIVSKSANKLFGQIKENYIKVRNSNIRPVNGNFFIEQSVYSATVLQMKLKYDFVGVKYDYPFSMHEKIDSKYRVSDLSSIVTAHYHNMLVEKPRPKYFDDFLNHTEKGKWLKQQIDELKIKPDNIFKKYLKRVKKKLSKNFF